MPSLLFEKFVVAENILLFGSCIIRAQREEIFLCRIIVVIEHGHGEGFAYLHLALIQLLFPIEERLPKLFNDIGIVLCLKLGAMDAIEMLLAVKMTLRHQEIRSALNAIPFFSTEHGAV